MVGAVPVDAAVQAAREVVVVVVALAEIVFVVFVTVHSVAQIAFGRRRE